MPKLDWIVLVLFLSGSEGMVLAAFASAQHSISPAPATLAETVAGFNSFQLVQRRPRRRLGGRDGGVCVISPALLEAENVVWSDRPLFLWQIKTEGIALHRLVVVDADGRILWEKSLAPSDQGVVYAGTSLQPGEFYQWQLQWTAQGVENSANYTFQVMAADRRNSITLELQALTRQLQASGASTEEIAHQQVDYLIEQPQPLWSDALKILYAVENPSVETMQRIQELTAVCGAEEEENP